MPARTALAQTSKGSSVDSSFMDIGAFLLTFIIGVPLVMCGVLATALLSGDKKPTE